jgi:hypothetical protein
LHLFGAFSVVDGWVGGLCRQRKRFVDFQAFVLEVVVPEAMRCGVHTVALILDNCSTHAPKQLQGWLEAQRVVWGWMVSIPGVLAADKCIVVGPDRDLIQRAETQVADPQPFRERGSADGSHPGVHRPL